MSTLRYYSEFRSHAAFNHEKSALYRIEIYGPDGEAEEITLAGEDPAVIAWGEVTKTEPVQGSSLTLRIVSESDRAFIHLYSTEVGEWYVKLYRNGTLYWVGTLDTELYEEPYSTTSGYEVEITFSDFGPLDRIDFEGAGMVSLQNILSEALNSAKLDDLSINFTTSTRLPDAIFSTPHNFSFDDISVSSENFYNEDGDPMSLREVLESILQPFALRMVQKNGKIEIFDLNAAYSGFDEQEVFWTSTNAVLDTDVTYNKVTVSLSCYADTTGISDDLDHDSILKGEEGIMYSCDTNWDDTAEGFRLAYAQGGETSKMEILDDGYLFRMDAAYSGSDCAGILWECPGNLENSEILLIDHSASGGSFPGGCPKFFDSEHNSTFIPLFRVKTRLNLSAVSEKYMLKLTMPLLLDARYNPFEEASEYNCEDDYQKMKDELHVVYVPFRLRLHPYSGDDYVYSNFGQINNLGKITPTSWRWDYWDDDQTTSCLAYYDNGDWAKNTGVGGWATNKQSCGNPTYMTTLMKKRGDGEYIPMPPRPGTLTLEIGRGICWRWDKDLKPGWYGSESRLWQRLRWLGYKMPQIEIVKKDGTDIEDNDIVDSAWIIKSAKEELKIDLTSGTPGDFIMPTARAFFRYTNSGGVVKRFERAGTTDRLERLLIGTVYSQYAKRRTILSGECELIPYICNLIDFADEGEKYILLSEVQYLIREESEIKMAQYGEDDYEGLEIISE